MYILRDVVHSDIMLYERFCKIINAVELLIYAIREEVHRFAITFHRQLRGKNTFSSKLDGIAGLGPKRKQLLMKHFKNLPNIQKASLDDIINCGIPKNVAENIQESLREEREKG